MALDLDALGVFVKVAELASFTRAAEHLGISKARASLRVRALEVALGAPLLRRTTRTVRPTADGELLLPRAKRLLAEADELAASYRGPRALTGVVRIDLPMTMARDTILPRVPELLAAHPQLELQVSTTDRRVDVVREGFDLVLRVGTLTSSELVAQRLGLLPVINCASPGYLHRRGTPRGVADLASHQLVHYAQRLGTTPPSFEYPTGDGGYALRPMPAAITVNSADAYLAACLAGLGIIQVPRLGARAALEAGTLVEILPDLVAEPMPVSLLHPHGRAVPRRVRVVMAWLASVVTPRLAR